MLAKLAILLSLIIGTTSAFYAHKTKGTIAVTKTAITKLENDVRELKKSRTVAQDLLQHQAEAPTLDTAITNLLVAVMRERLENGISVASVLPAKNVLASESATFDKLADSLDGTTLKSARFNVRGNYTSYEGFLNYVAKLRELPVAVVYMKVEANSFEVGLRAYGT